METFRSTINNSKNNRNNSKTFHISFIVKLISLYLIIVKSFSFKEIKTALTEKQQQQQQQQHYHGKQQYQFHPEQQ